MLCATFNIFKSAQWLFCYRIRFWISMKYFNSSERVWVGVLVIAMLCCDAISGIENKSCGKTCVPDIENQWLGVSLSREPVNGNVMVSYHKPLSSDFSLWYNAEKHTARVIVQIILCFGCRDGPLNVFILLRNLKINMKSPFWKPAKGWCCEGWCFYTEL